MDYVVPIYSKGNNVRVTLVIASVLKETGEIKYNYTHVDDFYPDLVVTHDLMNKIQSNDIYQVVAIEYYWDDIDFNNNDETIVNTIH